MSTECKVNSVDHLVLTVASIERSIEFYTKVLGMTSVTFGAQGRKALEFGCQKINLHEVGNEFKPHALHPVAGSADLCFTTTQTLESWLQKLKLLNVPVIEGPVPRTGAVGTMHSIYIRDPDENLIEIAYYS